MFPVHTISAGLVLPNNMIIEITSSETNAPEWVILELQGGVQPLSQTTGKGALQQSIASAERALDGCLMGNVSLLAVSMLVACTLSVVKLM